MTVETALQALVKDYGMRLPENVVYRGKKAFLVPEHVQEITRRIDLEPFSAGLPLGEMTSKGFKPSFALLDLLQKSKNRIIIADDVEWLFTCGRDVFMNKVLYEGELKKTFLVTNKKGEVLGLGRKQKKGKQVFIKNLYDRGDFLRRENKKK
ncbi:hypothetical protein GF367_04280 [Candidatus Woesearchaeota archaeon]|nr:hypothetical protein [Candidatus Woesearchaeota archaeon]